MIQRRRTSTFFTSFRRVVLVGVWMVMMATTTSHHSSSLLVQAQFEDFADFFRPLSPPPPTPTPVPGNTPPPPAPTLASLSVFQSSFASGETISVSYDYAGATMSPQLNDRIAFYPIGQDPLTHTPTTYLFWCGRQVQCQGVPPTDGLVSLGDMAVSLEHRDPSDWTWPIPSGNYQVFLLRGHNPPFQILGQATQTIEVRSNPHLENVVPVVQAIEREIRQLISATPTLGPKFVRLSFHDCTGGCNGCVDMTFPDNAGLHIPIDALRPIVNRHENPSLGISRADIWALAAHIGADMAQAASPTKADFHMEFIGRQNCESMGQPCLDANGNPRECRDTLGPHVHIPEADTGTEELFHFFSSEFGFDVQETVALMGAHTLGSLNKTHSGFDAPNGWVRDNTLLDNDYYHELIGPRSNLVDLAPPWHRFRFDNSDLPGVPNKPAWRALPPAVDGSGIEEIFMLNVDIALVRQLSHRNMLADGTVTCEFVQFFATQQGVPRCPHAARSLDFAADYKFDNALWMRDFAAVYKKMLNHGYPYNPLQQCAGDLCVYPRPVQFSNRGSPGRLP